MASPIDRRGRAAYFPGGSFRCQRRPQVAQRVLDPLELFGVHPGERSAQPGPRLDVAFGERRCPGFGETQLDAAALFGVLDSRDQTGSHQPLDQL